MRGRVKELNQFYTQKHVKHSLTNLVTVFFLLI